MKFTIDSKDFRSITDRAATVCLKKGLPVTTGLLIKADKGNQKVTIRATNLNSYVEVYSTEVNVDVLESGSAFIEQNDLKKLYNVVGYITVESEEDSDNKSIRVSSSKKCGEVLAVDGEEVEFPIINSDPVFIADKSELLDTFAKLSCCLSKNGSRPVLTGFNVANVSGVNRVVSCDGLRLAMREVGWNFADDLNIVVPGFIVKELSKVSANKQEENVSVYTDNKRVKFEGNDYIFISKLLDGEYIAVDKAINIGFNTYSFSVAAEDLLAIGKEYSKIKGSGEKCPMFVCNVDGKIVTSIISDNYRTYDILEIEDGYNIPDDLRYALNPAFLKDAGEIFGKDIVTIKSDRNNSSLKPWKIEGGNGYSALILPIRLPNDMSNVERFISCA